MPDYFDFEVELLDMPGERRFRRFLLTTKDTTFGDLHDAIQRACGWLGYHLFVFALPSGTHIAGADDEDRDEVPPADDVRLSLAFHDDGLYSVLYNYDFGDDWWLMIHFRGVVTKKERFERKLVDGAGAFPPEDCGGPPGFRRLLRIIEKSESRAKLTPDEKEQIAWLGDWQAAFELTTVAAAFDSAKRPKRAR